MLVVAFLDGDLAEKKDTGLNGNMFIRSLICSQFIWKCGFKFFFFGGGGWLCPHEKCITYFYVVTFFYIFHRI